MSQIFTGTSTLSGIYNDTVIVEGNAIIYGDTLIHGHLTVVGNLNNDGGSALHELQIEGNLIVTGHFNQADFRKLTAEGTIGSGGSTVLSDGSTVSGSYNGNVIVNGSATLAADTTINGSLYVTGTLTNAAGHALTVYGDWVCANGFFFTPLDPSTVQGNVTIGGDALVSENVVTTTTSSHVTDTWYDGQFDQFVAAITEDLNTLTFPNNFTVTFTSGANAGLSAQVAINAAYYLVDQTTFEPGDGMHLIFTDPTGLPNPITIGDQFTASWHSINDSTFQVNVGQSPVFQVGADLILSPKLVGGSLTSAGLNGMGLPGANGLTVSVGANLTGQIDLGGGVDTATLNGGSGGALTVGGNVSNGSISLRGGDSTNANQSAGSGGTLTVQGDCIIVPINCSGGSAFDPSVGSGNGGTVTVNGDVIWCGILTNGGESVSTMAASTGSAGNITIFGDFTMTQDEVATQTIEANGGSINFGGELQIPADTDITCGSGGSIIIYGNTLTGFGDGRSDGGGIKASGGGLGGSVTALNSGINAFCGHAGSITLYGDLTAFSGLLATGGGSGSTNINAIGQDGGAITIYGHCNGRNIFNEGGAQPFDPELISNGGDVAYISNGAFHPGNGGTITVSSCEGMVIYAQGGDIGTVGSAITSPQEAGNGGIFYVSGGKAGCLINLDGGNVINNTSPTYAMFGGNAGTINAKWDLEFIYSNFTNFSSLSGGSVLTGIGHGGNGGVLNCGNDLKFGFTLNIGGGPTLNDNKLIMNGGNAALNGHGGNGGVIFCWGNLEGNQLLVKGGNGHGVGQPAGVGGNVNARRWDAMIVDISGGNVTDASIPVGSGGTAFMTAGCNIGVSFTMKDGTGGTAANANSWLVLGGVCSFKVLNMTSRVGMQIRYVGAGNQSGPGITLKIESMSGLQTLTKVSGGVQTANISAMLADSIFTYSTVGDAWYRHQGTTI